MSDIILPPIALLPFFNRNLQQTFLVLREGPNYPYNTLQQAAEDGAVTMAWGGAPMRFEMRAYYLTSYCLQFLCQSCP